MLDPNSDFSCREGTVSVQKEIVSVGQDVSDLNASFCAMRLGISDSFIDNDSAYVGPQMIIRWKSSVGSRY